jgi:hypothetical protein
VSGIGVEGWNSKLNRKPQPDSSFFAHRGSKVKWPTLRGAYLDDDTVVELKKLVRNKSIVFLDGSYKTNLNQWVQRGPIERAVFFEWPVKWRGGPTIFILCWIGNFHNGSIFHAAPQFPQIHTWVDEPEFGWEKMEYAAVQLYLKVAEVLYGDKEWDKEVRKFETVAR